MSSLSDHVRRDAEHAARSEIRIHAARYVRRMDELAKGEIKEAIEAATQSGEAVDGLELGRLAAANALGAYLGSSGPRRALGRSADDTEADTA